MAYYIFSDIVLIKFPFTDNLTFKKRPALILKNTSDGDVIVCRITSKLYNTLFDIDLNDWLNVGLKLLSVIRVHKIASLEKDMIDRKLGELNTLDKAIVTETIHNYSGNIYRMPKPSPLLHLIPKPAE